MKKFDFVIGNSPYQAEVLNEGDRANPVYDKFLDAAYAVADCVEMIHPARFLFDAGMTPHSWNESMLQDEHFKVLQYEPNSSKVFANTDIMGGVAITLRNSKLSFGAIKTFSPFEELNTIAKKTRLLSEDTLATIVSSQGVFRFSEQAISDFPEILEKTGKGTGVKIVSVVVDKLPKIFLNSPKQDHEYIKIIGRNSAGRFHRYIKKDYLQENKYIDVYKVLVPEANGSGTIGEVVPTPLIGEPLIAGPNNGFTDTFLCIGQFQSKIEAERCLKYIKSKFTRCMLGIKKVTQHNPKSTWTEVPLQDFSDNSDIEWSKPVSDIDKQLYKKYNLTEEEISFIESHVKEMK